MTTEFACQPETVLSVPVPLTEVQVTSLISETVNHDRDNFKPGPAGGPGRAGTDFNLKFMFNSSSMITGIVLCHNLNLSLTRPLAASGGGSKPAPARARSRDRVTITFVESRMMQMLAAGDGILSAIRLGVGT